MPQRQRFDLTRREFVKTGALAAAAVSVPASLLRANAAHAAGSDTIKIGVIGCGGRGTGAAYDAINAAPNTRITAIGDAFPERIDSSRAELAKLGDRATIAEKNCYRGFEAYKEVLASGVDSVILATPPHFRPFHFAAAIDAGKHVFFEKPVAVDGPGVRLVMEAGEKATKKGLAVVTGTQRRHENAYLEAMKRLRDGAIGQVVTASVYWNQGGLWMNERKPEWSDMEWQLRNWLYFTWLSGDHIVEQHVHNLDVANWVVGSHPLKAHGMGGRQVRTQPAYGHVNDHFAVEYEYAGGINVYSFCRQIDGCDSRVEEVVKGTDGTMVTSSGRAMMTGKTKWRFDSEQNNKPYVQEHTDMIESIVAGKPLNEAQRIAESTLTAIMGRMATYTGKAVTWEQALNSKTRLGPTDYKLGPLPVDPVAMPGRTKID